MDIQNFIEEFKKTFVYDILSQTLSDEQLFEHVVDGDAVLWFKEQTRQMWLMWEKAKAQAVPDLIELQERIAGHQYYHNDHGHMIVDMDDVVKEINGFDGWKAQAVPEWAVIVPKLSANYLFNKVPELGFKHQDEKDTVLYHLNYMASGFKESAKQFVEDDHVKQKAMIEAQEPAND